MGLTSLFSTSTCVLIDKNQKFLGAILRTKIKSAFERSRAATLPGSVTRSSPGLDYCGAVLNAARPFLIDNMIIRIRLKSFLFSANSISNRQYFRGSSPRPIRQFTAPRSPVADHCFSTRYTSRVESPVSCCKYKDVHFLPETLSLLLRLAPLRLPLRFWPNGVGLAFTRHSPLVTSHCLSNLLLSPDFSAGCTHERTVFYPFSRIVTPSRRPYHGLTSTHPSWSTFREGK
jgi:hypothetical protein